MKITTTLSAILAMSVSAQAANIVLNAGFDTGDFTSWTVIANSTVVTNRGSAISPQAGTHFAIGVTNDPIAFYQTLTTIASATYELTFYLARPNTNNANMNYRIDVFDGAPAGATEGTGNGDLLDVDLVDSDIPAPIGAWHFKSYQFTATSASTTLRFGDSGTSSVDPAIDTVFVDAIPEPGSLALFGLSGLALVLRRRR